MHGQLFCVWYCCLVFLRSGNRLWNDQNHVGMGVLLTYIIVNITLVNMWKWPEQLMLSVYQKIYIKEGLENTVVCHFPMLESAHCYDQNSPNCIWRPGFTRTRWGSLQRSPRPPSCMKGGERQEMRMKERGKGKEPQKAKRKRDVKRKEGNLGRS